MSKGHGNGLLARGGRGGPGGVCVYVCVHDFVPLVTYGNVWKHF